MKKLDNESVIHDWVNGLPFTQQALLMLSLRGPDGLHKYNTAKPIIYFIRGLILKPAYPDFAGMDGFMCTNYETFEDACNKFWKDTDQYPMHFLMHIIHASEVIAFGHPDEAMRAKWMKFYHYACHQLHMNPESKEQLLDRLFY